MLGLKIKNKPFLIFFSIIYFVSLIAEVLAYYSNNGTLSIVAKVISLSSLFLIYKKNITKVLPVHLLFILFIILGDFAFIYSEHSESYFLLNLISITGYYTVFLVYFYKKIKQHISIKQIIVNFLVFSFCCGLIAIFITEKVENLFVPILIKTIILSLTCSFSFLLFLRKRSMKYLFLFITFFSLILANTSFGIYYCHIHFYIFYVICLVIYNTSQYIWCIIMSSEY